VVGTYAVPEDMIALSSLADHNRDQVTAAIAAMIIRVREESGTLPASRGDRMAILAIGAFAAATPIQR